MAADDDPIGDDRLLTADVVEYHGGDDASSAVSVDIVQLKYSTRAPKRPWTTARLAEGAPKAEGASKLEKGAGRSRRKNTSLVKRLSDAVAYYIEKKGADWVLSHLRLRLVSNQPADPALVAAVQAGATAAKGQNAAMALVLRKVDGESREELERLWRASGQQSRAFTIFLRCLDLSGCGAEPRALLKTRLTGKLSPYAPANPKSAARSLVDLVHTEASPEGEQSPGLVTADVLAALGASSKRVLFPAPPRFETPEDLIETGDAIRVAEAVVNAESRQAVVHGDAGVGKTTTGLAMAHHLPPDSELIAYDCFGGGDYLNAGDQRHTERRALRQLTNELARRCGTPFLVVDDLDLPDLERRFRESLDSAAEAVQKRGGVLILLIDAADNAAYASRLDGDCVIPRLWATPMPEGARLVMSARSHRRTLIDPPLEAVQVELAGFDESASRIHLQRQFPEASGEESYAFHERTQGNPRVQSYVLKGGETSLEGVLERSERTPTDLFEEIYQSAVTHARDDERALSHAAALLALVRPGGLDTFGAVEGLATSKAMSFCRGLVPGARLESHEGIVEIAFRDEDFERFLAERVGKTRIALAHGRFATWCLEQRETDEYAARAVADHLFASGRTDELVDLVLLDEPPLAIEDDVARLEIRQRRARLALRAAEHRPEDGVRVVLLLAEMARERGGFAGVVHQAPGLAVRYADSDAVGRLFLREERDARWLGPAHLHAAAVLSADPTAEAVARTHLEAAHAWIRRWMREGRDQGWQLDNDDIVNEVVAVYRLDGPQAAADQALRWSPVTLLPSVAYGVGSELGQSEEGDALVAAVEDANLPVLGEAALVAGAWSAGARLGAEFVREVASKLVSASRSGRRRNMWSGSWVVDFVEAMAHYSVDASSIHHVLDVFGPETERHFDVFGESGRHSLRIGALKAALDGRPLVLSDLLPHSLQYLSTISGSGKHGGWPPIDSEDKDEREAESRRRKDYELWRERAGPVLTIASVRAGALVGDLEADTFRARLDDALSGWGSRSNNYYRETDTRWRLWCQMAVEAAGFADVPPDELEWLDEKVLASPSGEPGQMWLAMAQRAARWVQYGPLALRWVGQAVRWSADRGGPVVERRDLLLWAAQIALPLDEEYGRDLYLQALEVASDLDDDGAILLSAHARLVEATAKEFGPAEARALATRLPASVDALAPKVSNRDPLPYGETVRAALALSLDRGLATWARWSDDESMGISWPGSGAAEIAANGGLEPEEELALLRSTSTFRVDAATRTLDRFRPDQSERRDRAFDRIVTWVLRDTPVRSRMEASQALLSYGDSIGNSTGISSSADRLRRVVSSAPQLAPPIPSPHEFSPPELSAVAWRTRDAEEEARYAEAEASVAGALGAAKDAATSGRFDDLGELFDTATQGRARLEVGTFVDHVATVVRPSSRRRFLEAIITGTGSKSFARYQASETAEAVIRRLDAWRDSSDIRRSRGAIGELIIRHHLPALLGYWGEPRRAFDSVLELVPEEDRIPAIVKAVPLHLPDMSVYDLYGVFEALALLLPVDARGRVLAESLTRRERATRREGVLPGYDPEPEPDPAEALASFFTGLFGDRDRRVRWRALHAALEMLADLPLDRAQSIAQYLLARVDRNDANGHRTEGRLFLWLSSRVCVFQLMLRLAHDAPSVLLPFAENLVAAALDRELPHVVARELARRTALRLVDAGEIQFDDELVEHLRMANQPPACLTERPEPYPGSRHNYPPNHSWEDDEFGFGLIDEIGEWYPQLEACLDVEWGEVFERAKRWVMDEWGYRKALWWDEVHESNVPYTRDESRVDRGRIPPVEASRPYAEYHAMMMAAGELVDEGVACVRRPYFDPAEDPWSDWLRDHLPLRDDVWVSEWLGETPLEPELWSRAVELERWLDAADPEAFDAALGLGAGWEQEAMPEWMTIRASEDVVDSDRHGDTIVRSALVTSEKSGALIRALLDVEDGFWSLPDHDEPDVMNEVRFPGYELSGWLTWWDPEHEGLDKHDPYRHNSGASMVAPGPRATAVLALNGGPHVWTDAAGSEVLVFERWSDDPQERDHITQPYSQGFRLRAKYEALLRMLQKLDRDLIIAVTLQRNESYDRRRSASPDSSSRRPYDTGRTRTYLLRGDGTFTRCEPEN